LSRRQSSTTSSSSWFHRISTRPRGMQTTLLLNTYHAHDREGIEMRSHAVDAGAVAGPDCRVPHGCLTTNSSARRRCSGVSSSRMASANQRASRPRSRTSRPGAGKTDREHAIDVAEDRREKRWLGRDAVDDVVERRTAHLCR
jgi:hypothetical protein